MKNNNITTKIAITFTILVVVFIFALISSNQGFSYDQQLILSLRLPRILTALIVGFALGIAGMLLQSIYKNNLLDPSLIGINSAANLFSSVWLLFLPTLSLLTFIPAIFGGILAFIIMYLISKKNSFTQFSLIVVGIALNAWFSGLTELIGINNLNHFSGNKLSNINSEEAILVVSYLIILLIIAFLMHKQLELLKLSKNNLYNLGIPYKLLILLFTLIAILISSISTAYIGVITFISLMAPNISKLLVGYKSNVLMLMSGLVGALLLVLSDTIGRCFFGGIEVSASTILSIIGGPFLLYLLIGGNRNEGY